MLVVQVDLSEISCMLGVDEETLLPLSMRKRARHGVGRPRWRERTPAMTAGLTDHIWTFHALLTATFEPLDFHRMSG